MEGKGGREGRGDSAGVRQTLGKNQTRHTAKMLKSFCSPPPARPLYESFIIFLFGVFGIT